MQINSDLCHDNLVKNAKLKYAFDENKDFNEWQKQLREFYCEIMGINKIKQNACPENVIIESEEEKDGYRQIRFIVETEKDMMVPCYLLIPTTGKKSYPLAITLQGHKKGGMYNSVGIVKTEEDGRYQPRGAFALQAVKEGYAALCVEMRGMGELEPIKEKRAWGENCKFTCFSAMALGRTVLGERVWDISKSIDAMHLFPEVDTSKIVITGNSGGGTASFYAAAFDERITLSAPSCAFCTYKDSILDIHHCICNLIPDCYENFEMQDLAGLIAPRKLLVISGEKDDIFPIEGVKKGFETVKKIYQKAGVPENARLVVTPKNHYWCEDIVWPSIKEEF